MVLFFNMLDVSALNLSKMALREKLQDKAISGGAWNCSGGSPYGESTAPFTYHSLSLCLETSQRISKGGSYRSNPQEEDEMLTLIKKTA